MSMYYFLLAYFRLNTKYSFLEQLFLVQLSTLMVGLLCLNLALLVEYILFVRSNKLLHLLHQYHLLHLLLLTELLCLPETPNG